MVFLHAAVDVKQSLRSMHQAEPSVILQQQVGGPDHILQLQGYFMAGDHQFIARIGNAPPPFLVGRVAGD
ncbi:hypothetical protein SDC9_204825 [bioreactor metagenome]|uniref:Uncharacterized protein n=1 Tax=bioreactor metagenome TaxID=1076179 RepID=A0A645J0M1_9ZZZZ